MSTAASDAPRYWLDQAAGAVPSRPSVFPVNAVRADFPALSRTVDGRPPLRSSAVPGPPSWPAAARP